MAATLETIQPYVEQLFDDSDVQKHLARATANLRGAKSRAGKARSRKKALQDPTLRQRLLDSGRAAVAVGVAIRKGPEKQARRGRRRALLLITGVGAAAFLASNAAARERLLGLVGANGSEATGT